MSLAHAVAQLRHLYAQMAEGRVKAQEHAAIGLLGPAIEEIERFQSNLPSRSSPPAPRETTLPSCIEERHLWAIEPESMTVRQLNATVRALRGRFAAAPTEPDPRNAVVEDAIRAAGSAKIGIEALMSKHARAGCPCHVCIGRRAFLDGLDVRVARWRSALPSQGAETTTKATKEEG
jgi:hypothetical protein